MENKVCPGCKTEKPTSEFYKDRSKRDGLASWCISCRKAAAQATDRTEYMRNYQRRFCREYQREYRRQYIQRRHEAIANGSFEYSIPDDKRCSRCRKMKPIEEFSIALLKKDKHQGYCKACEAAYQRSPAGREAKRRYLTSEHGRRKIRAYHKQRPNMRRAIRAVHRAVMGGRLPKPSTLPCATCGDIAIHYHHESYAKEDWLDVIPLCRLCHKARHRELRQVASRELSEKSPITP